MAVTNRNWSKTMANLAHSAPAPIPSVSPAQPAVPRRRLAPNVIAMHAEERPPVVQTRSRRGRYPANVTRWYFSGRPRLYVGALCALRGGDNDDVPVRIFEVLPGGFYAVEAITGRDIVLDAGEAVRRARVINTNLVRTATVGACHVR
jgi:hypothetical protein